ncbi:HTH-type transcriptional activator CmpR [Methylobacterium radiotolerans]|jgi:DNA-binding transcriptional LysR family regulator|nr:HTH-type transcriptional activator CmpR [Methylobacterium radiotolerans]
MERLWPHKGGGMRMLNLSQVQTFLAVIDEGGIQSAAERLACSQPAVSQQLRKLEEFVGVPLVVRNRSRAVPTRDGELFLPKARSLIASADRARAVVSDRRLVVHASGNVGVYLAPRLIAVFERDLDRPGTVDLVITTNRHAVDALIAGEADIALTEWSEDHPAVEWQGWRREKLVVIAGPDHPLAKERCIPRQALLDHPIIGGEPGTGTGRALAGMFGPDAGRLRVARQLGSTAAVKEAVNAGLGLSVVFAYSVAEEVKAGTLTMLELEEADIFKTLFIGLGRESPQSSMARRFATFCLASA